MRYTLGKQNRGLRGRLKRLLHRTAIASAAVVATAPLLLSPLAAAAPNTTYMPRDFVSLGLMPDRSAPSGGFTVTDDLLTLNVDTAKANRTARFYQTEGLQAVLPNSSSVRAQLYVDSDWQQKPAQTGIWAVAGNSTDTNQIGWPILQFVSNTGKFTGFRTFNTFTGRWSNTSVFKPDQGWNKWYTLEISYNPNTKDIEFFVNNFKVDSYPAKHGTDTLNTIHGVIFNNFNTATSNPSDNYSVKWQRFETGAATGADAEACKNGGYTTMYDQNNRAFSDEGQCVSYMNGRTDNGNNPPVTPQNLTF